MAGLDELLNKIDRIQKEVPKKVLPKVEQMMRLSLNQAMADFYGYPEGVYQRTGNFMSLTHNPEFTFGEDEITMKVSSSSMSDYPGITKPLSSDAAFDFMFLNGEHGHGIFQSGKSIPPNMLISQDVESGFNGQIQSLVDMEVAKILG